MSSTAKKSYDEVFKRRALALAESSGKQDYVIEEELGIFKGGLARWRNKVKNEKLTPFPGKGHLTSHDEEIRQLKRELELTRMERDILKKAAAIFLQPPKAGMRL